MIFRLRVIVGLPTGGTQNWTERAPANRTICSCVAALYHLQKTTQSDYYGPIAATHVVYAAPAHVRKVWKRQTLRHAILQARTTYAADSKNLTTCTVGMCFGGAALDVLTATRAPPCSAPLPLSQGSADGAWSVPPKPASR